MYDSTDGSDGTFVNVSTGLFGGHASLAPLDTMKCDDVVVPHTQDRVKDAPKVRADRRGADAPEEQRLFQHDEMTGAGSARR